jgi:lipoprotein NlpD
VTPPAARHRRALGGAVVGLTAVLLAHAATQAPSQPGPPARVHEVKPGDTLSAIAQTYGVSVAAIVAANRLPGDEVTLRIGQRLTIPPSVPAMAGARLPARRSPPRPPVTLVLAVPDFGDLQPLFAWPVDGAVSSTFGRRRSGWHRGVDIKADHGAPVLAAAPGLVIASGLERRYGRVVKIEHAHGFVTVYAHNDHNLVEVGEHVSAGQTIAVIGRSGRATAHHLHFEIRHGGLAYNPLYLLPLPPRVVLIDESEMVEHEESDE